MPEFNPIPLSEDEISAIRQEAMEFAGIGLYRYRFDGVIQFMDRGALRILGLDTLYSTPDQVTGKNIDELILYAIPKGKLRQQIRIYGHARNFEYPFRTLTGLNKWAIHDSYMVVDPKTGEQMVQVIIQDITERKQAEAALQQAREELELRVQERTAGEREQRTLAEALRDIAALLNSTLQLDEVLDRILSEIQRVVPHDTANVVLLEQGKAQVVRYREQAGPQADGTSPGSPGLGEVEVGRQFSLDELPNLYQMMLSRQPVIIADTAADPNWVRLPETAWARSYLGAPIQRAGQVIGFISLKSAAPNFYQPVHAERLQAFSEQAAIAIQNARLYQHAQELAALEERQRLARDLHDAVSQTLWTAALTAEVLPALWELDQAEARLSLARLQRLTRGALAEMRALLLELRPKTLAQAHLGDLMKQLAQATMSHKKIDILVEVEGECNLPEQVKVGLYRLTQEAMNNAAKHARATQVALRLCCADVRITLTIRDNGRGFNPNLTPEGLGLRIMHERAEEIGATLQIESAPGAGTLIQINWPD